jgi:pimeloyl-ACP methyl ester carboxylesterase
MQPRSHVWQVNGLDHHVLEWGPDGESTPSDARRATAIVVHGFQDCAATWDDVAGDLAAAGLRVLAPDMRGFGDGARVPAGAYYYFPDYVSDLAGIVRAHAGGGPLFVIGHSMGATVVSYFAGAFPERVTKLALIDGVGPPDNPFSVGPIRMRRWIETAYETGVAERKPMTRADALSRLQRFNPDIDEAVLARKVAQLSREIDGGVAWKHDPLHGTTGPLAFFAETYRAFAHLVTCPALHVSGGTRGHHVPDEEERLASFPRLTRVTIEGGHALHWSKPRELAEALVAFWRGP